MEKITILGISGSLRKGSYNTALLKEFKKLAPSNIVFETYVPRDLPLFNQDIESPVPSVVKEFKNKIENSDAILFASPEHNNTITAVMKNAIEWGSRPSGQNSWDGKPAMAVSASTSMFGGARSQLSLRINLVHVNVFIQNRPQFYMANAAEKFDDEGNLKDEHTKEKIIEVFAALIGWTRKLSK